MGLLKPKTIYEDGIPKQLKYGFYHYDEILELILTYGIKLYLFIINLIFISGKNTKSADLLS